MNGNEHINCQPVVLSELTIDELFAEIKKRFGTALLAVVAHIGEDNERWLVLNSGSVLAIRSLMQMTVRDLDNKMGTREVDTDEDDWLSG